MMTILESGWNLGVWLECLEWLVGVAEACKEVRTYYRYSHNNYYFLLLHLY